MKKILSLLFLSLVWSFSGKAQSCTECRYISPVFDSVLVSTHKFGEGPNATGALQELYLDSYEPYGDTLSVRPLIIFAFGGGFVQGARNEDYVIKACQRYARSGFVAWAIDYRIGFDLAGGLSNPPAELMRTFFRPMQDMRGAIQFANAHADSLGNTFRLDTNFIFIGGASSGAITSLHVSHCDKDSEFAEMGSLSAISALGGFYSTSGLYPNRRWNNIAGTFNIAGALVNSKWIEAGDSPILSAHGDQDGTVPYGGGNLNLGITQVGLEGSYLVDRVADSLGVCSFLYTMVGEDHPSGSADDAYYDEIYQRFQPRFHALLHHRSYCCDLGLSIDPGGVQSLNPGQSITLNANLVNSLSNTSYLWCSLPCNYNGNTAQITTVPPVPGHVVAVAWEGACQATDFVRFQTPVGRPEAGYATDEFSIGPNPVTDLLHIRSNKPGKKALSIRIFNASGQEVRQYHWACTTGDELSLDLSSLKPGVYFIGIRQNDNLFTKKIIRL